VCITYRLLLQSVSGCPLLFSKKERKNNNYVIKFLSYTLGNNVKYTNSSQGEQGPSGIKGEKVIYFLKYALIILIFYTAL